MTVTLPWVLRSLAEAGRWLSTPLSPEDYLSLLDPLWPAGELRGRVEELHPETADATTLVIRPGRGWRAHRPGQWARIGVDVEGRRHWRTYSLSSPPHRPDGRITITVKAAPDGFVSRHLVRSLTPGTIVRLAGPDGAFVLPEPVPPRLLFLTAGSGITPVMAMLSGGIAADVVLIHSAPTPQEVIFGDRLRRLAARSPYLRLYERHTRSAGRLRPADLAVLCPDWTQRAVWACGPPQMLDDLAAEWPGPAERLRTERFTEDLHPAGGTAGGRVRFATTGRETDADGATPLLTAGEDAGVLMPSGCRMGVCHTCVAPLRSGRVRDLRSGLVHGEAGDLIQTCVSAAAGPVELEL
ncbi:ferredoxin reductase [Herbidospora galbida]|uniref:Ferredoxin reductase n=1 Tax=Herbidospora galbida TaxID=2575442 RepID=A0A4U3MJ34_9ACTN|nr:ferredoxin reductase [Herbidospora galbida]TKK89508.1 ferredoxin reductase [Herbidospora galbida]